MNISNLLRLYYAAAVLSVVVQDTSSEDVVSAAVNARGETAIPGSGSVDVLPGFYITMKSHTSRRQHLETLLRKEPSDKVNVVAHVADEWYKANAGAPPEPGVSDSHVAVVRRCIALGLPVCLILEDDATWDAPGTSLFETFQRAIQDVGSRPWDVIVMGHNILRGKYREMTHGPFSCEKDLEIVTPTLARLSWRTGWGCQAYVVHERYYGEIINKMWGSKRYACIEEFTNVGNDHWYLTSPLPVSQEAKKFNFEYSQTSYLKNCEGKSPPAVPAIAATTPSSGAATCVPKLMGDLYCDQDNNMQACNWDGGDCWSRRPFVRHQMTLNEHMLRAAQRNMQQLIASSKSRAPLPRVHILHVPKAGGLSIRTALGCFCGSDDYTDPAGGHKAGNCDRTTYNGPFVCHGHAAKCSDIPDGEPYVVFFRHPFSKVESATQHQQMLFPTITLPESALVRRKRSPHQRPQSDYISCRDHPPAFVGHTETLAQDWTRFREAFAPEIVSLSINVPEVLPHRHDRKQRQTTQSLADLSDPELLHTWHRQIAVQYRADFSLGNYSTTVLEPEG